MENAKKENRRWESIKGIKQWGLLQVNAAFTRVLDVEMPAELSRHALTACMEASLCCLTQEVSSLFTKAMADRWGWWRGEVGGRMERWLEMTCFSSLVAPVVTDR